LITENLSTLKIHKLTQEQYDRALASGNIDANALYLTPEDSPDWNASEGEDGYIKNRTHWVDYVDFEWSGTPLFSSAENIPAGTLYPYKIAAIDKNFNYCTLSCGSTSWSVKVNQTKWTTFPESSRVSFGPGDVYLAIYNGELYMYATSAAMGHLGVYTINNCGNVNYLPSVYIDEDIARRSQLYEIYSSVSNLDNLVGDTAVSEQISEAIASKSDVGHTHTAMALKSVEAKMPSVQNWQKAAYGDGKFVSAGRSADAVAYSTNGVNWTKSGTVANRSWSSIAYGNGKFVMVSYGDRGNAYSTDGITWFSPLNMPESANWDSVTYGDGKFVAVAYNSSTAAYSTDGITWTATNMLSSKPWDSVTYGDGKFVAVSQSSTAAYSTDGIAWTKTDMPSSKSWTSVTYGDGKFITVGSNSSTVAYSTDGITWTETNIHSSANWNSIAYGNGKFVVTASNNQIIAYSTDGITWTTRGVMQHNASWHITYGDGKFVAIGGDTEYAAYSTDGITWHTSAELIEQDSAYITIPVDSVDGAASVDVVNAHIQNKENPHGVTAEQIGAYFVNRGNVKGYDDFNTKTETGVYYCNTWAGSGGANFPNGQDSGMMFVLHPKDNYIQQIYISDTDGIIRRMKWDDEDDWKPWEYETPPMKLGVEYRTTERWQGTAVYTKLIDCGKMPNNTQVSIPHGISMDKVIRHCGYGGTSTIPYSTTVWTPTATTHSVDVAVSTYAIYIRTNYDASAESAMIQLWYTKA
jgi:hypothetical protein